MSPIALSLTTAWRRLCTRFGLCFDLEGVSLDDADLAAQLGYGRD